PSPLRSTGQRRCRGELRHPYSWAATLLSARRLLRAAALLASTPPPSSHVASTQTCGCPKSLRGVSLGQARTSETAHHDRHARRTYTRAQTRSEEWEAGAEILVVARQYDRVATALAKSTRQSATCRPETRPRVARSRDRKSTV